MTAVLWPALWALLIIAHMIFAGWVLMNYKPQPVKIDCRIAEISPDIPPKAREQCRRSPRL